MAGNLMPSEAEKERDKKMWEHEQAKAKLQVSVLASPLFS
jgi:hypothetical protein